MKFLAMHIINQKLSFEIFTVGNLQNNFHGTESMLNTYYVTWSLLTMLPLNQIMRKNPISYHSYADDTQIYLALSPNDYSPI